MKKQQKPLPSRRVRIGNFLVAMLTVLAVQLFRGIAKAMISDSGLGEAFRLALPGVWTEYLASLAVGVAVFLFLEYRNSKKTAPPREP